MKRKPTDEQLLHTLDIIPNDDPENNDFLLIFSFECLSNDHLHLYFEKFTFQDFIQVFLIIRYLPS